MSPRAAWRLGRLGFGRVHDYEAGKADWLAFALPYEGEARLVADRLTIDVDTCDVDDSLGAVRGLLQASPFGMLVVLTADGLVAGTLALDAADGPDDAAVEDLMGEGPTTVRPSEDRTDEPHGRGPRRRGTGHQLRRGTARRVSALTPPALTFSPVEGAP